jgi:AAA ATPase-like protein
MVSTSIREGPIVVGREAELAAVAAFVDARPATARALVVKGEAGIGKTTLLRALRDAHEARACACWRARRRASRRFRTRAWATFWPTQVTPSPMEVVLDDSTALALNEKSAPPRLRHGWARRMALYWKTTKPRCRNMSGLRLRRSRT